MWASCIASTSTELNELANFLYSNNLGCRSKVYPTSFINYNHHYLLFLYVMHTWFSVPGGLSLKLVELRIPSHAVRNQSARLECHFDLDGETLYSVKWYKDGNEFYRYVPRDHPPVQYFPLPGVTVDVSIGKCSPASLNNSC